MTSPQPAGRLAGLPRLGVGLSYQGTLRRFVLEHLDSFDFLEVIPDIFWSDQGRGIPGRYRESADAAPFLVFTLDPERFYAAGSADPTALHTTLTAGLDLLADGIAPETASALERCLAVRDRHPDRFLDVWFLDAVKDPVAQARRIYDAAHLGLPLVLSGHTHGGQVVMPGIGAVAARKFPVAEGLLFQDATTLFVSRGIGTVYVPLRVNCPPEVALLTLVPRTDIARV